MHIYLQVSVKVVRNLNTKEEPCNNNKEYNFHKCFESFFYEKQGCQYPWNHYKDLKTPTCNNLTNLKDLDNTLDPRAKFSNLRRVFFTEGKCFLPCVTRRYKLVQEKDEEKDIEGLIVDNGSMKTYSLRVVFDNFVIEKREEFLACDTTCVIGELGGNLGFFLGGSILALFDVIINYSINILTKFNFRKNWQQKSV